MEKAFDIISTSKALGFSEFNDKKARFVGVESVGAIWGPEGQDEGGCESGLEGEEEEVSRSTNSEMQSWQELTGEKRSEIVKI